MEYSGYNMPYFGQPQYQMQNGNVQTQMSPAQQG